MKLWDFGKWLVTQLQLYRLVFFLSPTSFKVNPHLHRSGYNVVGRSWSPFCWKSCAGKPECAWWCNVLQICSFLEIKFKTVLFIGGAFNNVFKNCFYIYAFFSHYFINFYGEKRKPVNKDSADPRHTKHNLIKSLLRTWLRSLKFKEIVFSQSRNWDWCCKNIDKQQMFMLYYSHPAIK